MRPSPFLNLDLSRSHLVGMIDDGELIVAGKGFNDRCVFINDCVNIFEPCNTVIRLHSARHELVSNEFVTSTFCRMSMKGNCLFIIVHFMLMSTFCRFK